MPLLLLLLTLEADAQRMTNLIRLSPFKIKEIADQLDIRTENLLASVSHRRPMPSGERLAKLQKIVGVRPTDGALENQKVLVWKFRPRYTPEFITMSKEVFPFRTCRTDLYFANGEEAAHMCLHSKDFVVLIQPSLGIDLSHLDLIVTQPKTTPISAQEFANLPADRARQILDSKSPTWSDAVALMSAVNISPEHAIEWAQSVRKATASSPDLPKN
jgi:hypothetical protein